MCAVLFEGQSLLIGGTPVPDVTGTYAWKDYTTVGAENFDHWENTVLGYDVWYSAAQLLYVAAGTYPAEPGAGNNWWMMDKSGAEGNYYPQGTAAGLIDASAADPEETPWQQWGMSKNWLTRSGVSKPLPGQRMWMRTNFPPDYGVANYLDYPDAPAALPSLVDSSCLYWPDKEVAWLWLKSDASKSFDATSGLSIFQVRPTHAGQANERRFTRFAAFYSPYFASAVDGMCYKFYPVWNVPQRDGLRIFARAYYRTSILNLGGPIWSDP